MFFVLLFKLTTIAMTKIKFLIVTVFILTAISISAQDLYPNLFDQSNGITNGFGSWGNDNYVRETTIDVPTKGTITFYHPDIVMEQKPVIFFISGWANSFDYYDKYLKYLTSLGYSVVHIFNLNPGSISFSYQSSLDMMQQAVTEYSGWIDTTKVGLFGHSYGAGSAIWLGKNVFDANGLNWGTNGRTILMLNPWYSFLMEDTDLQNYPANVKLLVIQSHDDLNTDPRILRAMYQLINIPDEDKDFITIFSDEDPTHEYNYNGTTFSYLADHYISYTAILDGNRNPYDALDVFASNRLSNAILDYVFEENPNAQTVALGNGSALQIDMGIMPDLVVTDYYITSRPESDFEYKCSDNEVGTWGNPEIWKLQNYCADDDNNGVVDTLLNADFEINTFNIYPNPSNKYLKINLIDSSEIIKNIEIINVLGKSILQNNNLVANTIDISALNSGTYFIKVETEKTASTKKFIIKK